MELYTALCKEFCRPNWYELKCKLLCEDTEETKYVIELGTRLLETRASMKIAEQEYKKRPTKENDDSRRGLWYDNHVYFSTIMAVMYKGKPYNVWTNTKFEVMD